MSNKLIEKQVTTELKEFLESNNIYYDRINQGLTYTKIKDKYVPMSLGKGRPDMYCTIYGEIIYIELKADKTKKLNDNQKIKFKEIYDKSNAWILVCNKDNIADIKDFLQRKHDRIQILPNPEILWNKFI